jgi:D-lactate dehydrogenase
VDTDAAEAHSTKVMNIPVYLSKAIVEHATALILTLNRKTHKTYNRIKENNFSLEALMGFNLYDKTVGRDGRNRCRVLDAT